MIATITLNPSIDQFIIVENLVTDDANRAKEIFREAGGKGVNVSKVITELKGPTHAYALKGGLSGSLWENLLRRIRIPFTAMEIHGDTRINTILTDIKKHTQTRISAPGPCVSQKDLDKFLKRLLAARPRPFLWALGGSLSAGMKNSTYRDFVSALQKNGTPCILDTDNEALRLGIQAKPYAIKPNEHEIQRLCNKKLSTIEDYLKAAGRLVEKGIRIVIVSLGAKGALFVTKEKAFHVLTPRVPVKSKVGAGDSLIGGFSLGLYRRMDFQKAACLGVAASTSAVMTEGVRLCRREDIPRLLPRIKVRPLT